MLILISNIIYGKYSCIHSKESLGTIWEKERMFLWPMFSKVSCKFEAINSGRQQGSHQVLSLRVGELYQQNQRPTKHTQVIYWVTALNESPGHQTFFFLWDRYLYAYHLLFRATNYSDTVVLYYYYVHGVMHQGQNYDISYFALILNLKIITIIINHYYYTTLTKECEDITPFPS